MLDFLRRIVFGDVLVALVESRLRSKDAEIAMLVRGMLDLNRRLGALNDAHAETRKQVEQHHLGILICDRNLQAVTAVVNDFTEAMKS